MKIITTLLLFLISSACYAAEPTQSQQDAHDEGITAQCNCIYTYDGAWGMKGVANDAANDALDAKAECEDEDLLAQGQTKFNQAAVLYDLGDDSLDDANTPYANGETLIIEANILWYQLEDYANGAVKYVQSKTKHDTATGHYNAAEDNFTQACDKFNEARQLWEQGVGMP